MAKVSGHGGYWVIEGTPDNAIVHNAECEIEVENEVYEARSAGCSNWTEGLPVINRVASAMMMVAEDDLSYPQALGLTQGAEVTLWFRRGELGEYDKVTRTIVRSVSVINDQQKARRVRIVCQHGLYERTVTEPTLP